MPGYFSPTLRRRLAPLLLVGGVLLFGKIAHEEMPQDQPVRYALSPAQQSTAAAIRVTYTADNELFSGVERRFPEGAPAVFTHTPSLKPGRYDVSVELISRDGRRTRVMGAIEVPSEASPRISLAEVP
jgi:hypothetical protein